VGIISASPTGVHSSTEIMLELDTRIGFSSLVLADILTNDMNRATSYR
jgi:predicted O-methyltransferase YrrM